jgi:hypothetical protein
MFMSDDIIEMLTNIFNESKNINKESDAIREYLTEFNKLFCGYKMGIEIIDSTNVLHSDDYYHYVWAFDNRGLFFAKLDIQSTPQPPRAVRIDKTRLAPIGFDIAPRKLLINAIPRLIDFIDLISTEARNISKMLQEVSVYVRHLVVAIPYPDLD